MYERYKKIFKEFVVEDISALKQYLSMDDSAKGEELLYNFSYIIDDYLYELEDLNDEEINEFIEEAEWDVLAQHVRDNYPKIFDTITKKILKRNLYGLGIPEQELPSWVFFKYPRIIKNQWLIHFTEEADKIARSGFDYLVDDITRLGLTTWMSKKYDRSKKGYGFSYTIHDYGKYGKSGRATQDYKGWKYGSEVVLFRASGLRVWHVGDEEFQTIFKGDTVKEIIPIMEGEEKDFAVYNKRTNTIIFEDNDLVRLVDWVILNYDQYRKVI